jgi:hypothetical protein
VSVEGRVWGHRRAALSRQSSPLAQRPRAVLPAAEIRFSASDLRQPSLHLLCDAPMHTVVAGLPDASSSVARPSPGFTSFVLSSATGIGPLLLGRCDSDPRIGPGCRARDQLEVAATGTLSGATAPKCPGRWHSDSDLLMLCPLRSSSPA